MNWFLIALIGPLLYAITNHIDKYLISKYLKNGEFGALIIFSSIFSIVALPVVFFISPDVFSVSLLKASILAINGMLIVVSIFLYFHALSEDDASVVVPFYQTVPIFTFILGYFVLGETISIKQAIASLVIILGTLVLSFDIGFEEFKFKKKIVIFMLSASFLYAVNSVVFKLFAIDDAFWVLTFWELVGKVILGFIFLVFFTSYRKQFFTLIKENSIKIFGLNSVNESLSITADTVSQFATLLAPVFLVSLVNSTQPLFVFIIGAVFTLFFPKIINESLKSKQVIQKLIGIGLIIGGSIFM